MVFAQRDGKTVTEESFFRTPLQVMRSIHDSAGCVCIYLLSPAGGVVQGDTYCIDITAGAGSHALLTTLSATKVYRTPHQRASQVVHIELHEGAVFEYLPDALILFKDADLYQEVNITLHKGAVLIFQEIVMPGRLASGEVLQFRRYTNRLTVRDTDGLILYDSVCYEPATGDLARLGLLDGYTCWGTWYILGDLERLGIHADQFCQMQHMPWNNEALGSISALYRNGIGARVISQSLAPVYATFTHLWQLVLSS